MTQAIFTAPGYEKWKAGALDTIAGALDRAVSAVPDRLFLDIDGQLYSYAQFDRLVTRLAHAFAGLGVGGGDTVVTFLDTSIDPLVSWFAANRIGAIWVPVNTAYRGHFLSHQISDSGAKLMICEAHYLPHLLAVADGLHDLERVLVRGGDGAEHGAGRLHIASLDAHRGTDDTPIARTIGPGDLTCLMYTSGTTGPSKGCMIPQGQIMQFGWRHWEAAPQGPDEVAWSPLPIFHVGALITVVVSALISQGSGALTSGFSVTNFWPEVKRTGASYAFILGSMFVLLADAPENPSMVNSRGQLRIVTGVPVSAPIRAIWNERFGVPYINSCNYAQSESAKLGHVAFGDPLPPLHSAGYVNAADFDLMIADDDGRAVEPGETGELLFRPRRAHIMFAGYWRRPQATVDAWKNLWMHTGDLARIDEKGILYFVDRKKDYLRRGGENISSWEMEATFKQHPAIADVAVHAVKSQLAEDEVKVTAVLKDGAAASAEEVFDWCVSRVPRFAIPAFIEFRPALPMTPTGKIQKYQLRDEGRTASTWSPTADRLKVARKTGA